MPSRHQRKKLQRRRKAAKISAHAYGLKYVIRDIARQVIREHIAESQELTYNDVAHERGAE